MACSLWQSGPFNVYQRDQSIALVQGIVSSTALTTCMPSNTWLQLERLDAWHPAVQNKGLLTVPSGCGQARVNGSHLNGAR